MLTFRENESETAQGKRIKENVLKSKDNSKEGFYKSVLEYSFFLPWQHRQTEINFSRLLGIYSSPRSDKKDSSFTLQSQA